MKRKGSEPLGFSRTDAVAVLKGAAIAAAGAVLTYAAETIPGIDFGQATPVVAAIAAILINAARKWLTDTTGK